MSDIWTNVDAPETYPKVSVTELKSLLRCTRQHNYAYRQGLVPTVTPDYFTKGKFLHKLQEAFWTSLKDGGPLTADETIDVVLYQAKDSSDPLPDTETLSEVIAVFRAWHKETLPLSYEYEVLAVEQEFLIDIELSQTLSDSGLQIPVLLHGIIDLLVRDAEGNLWVVDHKTAGRAWSAGNFIFDFQSRLYARAVETYLLEAPAGAMFQFFYPKRFETRLLHFDSVEIDGFVQEVQNALLLREDLSIIRQPHWGCNDCRFKALCHAELCGVDSEYVRHEQFTVDQDKVDRFTEEA